MDILYPCSLCSKTFESRKQFLIHTTTVHASNVSSIDIYDSKNAVNCAHCCKQFSSKGLLKKHIRLKHNNSIQNLITKSSLRLEEHSISQIPNDNTLLKDFLPDNYTYKILAFRDLLFGEFKVKFQIINIDIEQFLYWMNNLCLKTKVSYDTSKISSNSIKYGHRKVYRCKNIDYWNKQILQNPTDCKATLSVVIKQINKELSYEPKATIVLNHCHRHPMNYFTPIKLYPVISNVYTEMISLFQNDISVANALQIFREKIIVNEGKIHYLNLVDAGIKPDVDFLYDLYYIHIGMSKFTSPFTKRVESLVESVNFYNTNIGTESAVIDFVENDIVIAIRTPFMRTVNTDTVLVCSTNFNINKTWFMFGQNDNEIIMPVGVIIATDDSECMLEAGLNLWKRLGGTIKTVVVEFIHCNTFQSVFPKTTVSVSKFHFLLGVWKWFFNDTKKNDLNDKLNCFIELKKLVYSENFTVKHNLDTKFASVLLTKYPNFQKFMQNIFRTDFLFCSSIVTNPCSSLFERKLIYYQTKSFSILQMFHFVIDEIELFYNNFSTGNVFEQQLVLNNIEDMEENEENFTYYCVDDNFSMYLIESDKHGIYFVDTNIGLCSCTINDVGAPCIHQVFLNNHLKVEAKVDQSSVIKSINCSLDAPKLNVFKVNSKDEQIFDKNEFENILSEFRLVNNKIKNEFINDPSYFKDSLQSFVSTVKNNLISDESLFLACHSLKNTNLLNLDENS